MPMSLGANRRNPGRTAIDTNTTSKGMEGERKHHTSKYVPQHNAGKTAVVLDRTPI